MTEQHFFGLLSLIIVIIGILGTFLPVIPGLVICFAGLLVYKFLANPEFSWLIIICFGILTLASGILGYVIPMKTTQRYGGSRYGSIGGLLGMIVGLIFFPPFGLIIGLAAGAYLGEIFYNKNDRKRAARAAKGALVGFLYGAGFNFLTGCAMLAAVLWDMFGKNFF